jgi:hypothetical protein
MIEINKYSSEEIYQMSESSHFIYHYLFDKYLKNGDPHGPDIVLTILFNLFGGNVSQHGPKKEKKILDILNNQFKNRWKQWREINATSSIRSSRNKGRKRDEGAT